MGDAEWGVAGPCLGGPSGLPTFARFLLQLQRVRRLLLDLVSGSLVLCVGDGTGGCDGGLRAGVGPPARPRGPAPFAWSLSSWLTDFFQSSMRSCSGLMRLSSRALRGRGGRGSEPPPRGGGPPAAPTHLVNCRSFVSMLRCRMHMRVSAEPMSRVAPGEAKAPRGDRPGAAAAVPAAATRGRDRSPRRRALLPPGASPHPAGRGPRSLPDPPPRPPGAPRCRRGGGAGQHVPVARVSPPEGAGAPGACSAAGKAGETDAQAGKPTHLALGALSRAGGGG